jgi:diacylglycerol kinase (ATP)
MTTPPLPKRLATAPRRLGRALTGVTSWRKSNGVRKKLASSLNGLTAAVARDRSVRRVALISSAAVIAAAWHHRWVDVVIIITVSGLLTVTELLNTAVEELCDYIEPRFDVNIGRIKEITAAAVLVALVTWVLVIVTEACRVAGWIG